MINVSLCCWCPGVCSGLKQHQRVVHKPFCSCAHKGFSGICQFLLSSWGSKLLCEGHWATCTHMQSMLWASTKCRKVCWTKKKKRPERQIVLICLNHSHNRKPTDYWYKKRWHRFKISVERWQKNNKGLKDPALFEFQLLKYILYYIYCIIYTGTVNIVIYNIFILFFFLSWLWCENVMS